MPRVYILVLCLLRFIGTYAQDLEYLPPVITHDLAIDSGTSLILGTIDYARFGRRAERKPYLNSLQIIDADQSWPPRWYTATTLYTHEMFIADSIRQRLRYYHMGYAQTDQKYLSYIYLAPRDDNDISGQMKFGYSFIILDTDMNAIDTIKTRLLRGGTLGKKDENNPLLEKLMTVEMDTTLDFSQITGHKKDTAVKSNFWVIQVLDNKDNVKLTWNPLFKLAPDLFMIREQLAQTDQNSDGIRWKKLNNVCWDYDGNILYSSEVGIGKISRQDGHVIWSLNSSISPFNMRDNTLKCFSPTGFLLCEDSHDKDIYMFFDRGLDSLSPTHGVVFERDKKSGKIKNVRYIPAVIHYPPCAHGGFDYDPPTGRYALDYGFFTDSDAVRDFRPAMDCMISDSHHAVVYQLPKWNYAFGFNFLKNWPRPPRPVIRKQGTALMAEGGTGDLTWYKLEGPDNDIITKIGTSKTIIPQQGMIYCVAQRYGVGYAVSRPYDTKAHLTH